ncbi:MAG TPA: YitT family protein, partial [Anaerolineae bacterium]
LGGGLIYRAGGTAGAGGILNLTLQKWRGWPIRLTTLATNGLIIGLAGLVFGWEAAMYAFISFYVSGTLADFVLEGPDVVRTALIITAKADPVAGALMGRLGRGVTRWNVTGMHSNENHAALYCTVTRPQIKDLKNTVAWADPDAFVIIGQGREALGEGFRSLEPDMPVVEDVED